jgi:hypothetical protein
MYIYICSILMVCVFYCGTLSFFIFSSLFIFYFCFYFCLVTFYVWRETICILFFFKSLIVLFCFLLIALYTNTHTTIIPMLLLILFCCSFIYSVNFSAVQLLIIYFSLSLSLFLSSYLLLTILGRIYT